MRRWTAAQGGTATGHRTRLAHSLLSALCIRGKALEVSPYADAAAHSRACGR